MKTNDARFLSKDSRESLRKRVVAAVIEQGIKQCNAARLFGVCAFSVSKWVRKYKTEGESGLATKAIGARPTGGRLRHEHWLDFQKLLMTKTPSDLDLPFTMWDRKAIRALLLKRFNVSLMAKLLPYALLLLMGCIAKPGYLKPTVIDKQVVDARAEVFLQKMMLEDHFTGVALVMDKGNVVHAKGYGMAGDGKSNDVTTLFHVASITKQFTAAAVMQLIEKGLIDLHGPINEYLPMKYRSPKWRAVTVHHLLSHSSGIEDYAVTRDYYHVVNGFCLGDTVDGMIKEAMAKDLLFAPGTKFSYTNLGYTLLGLAIETQTKMSFDKYIKENILNPMGMRFSTIHMKGHAASADEAMGYRFDKEEKRHVFDDEISLPVTAPDGGMITSLNDFIRWIDIYKKNGQKILTQASIEKMTTPAIKTSWGGPDGILDFYGYGLFVKDSIISHMGEIVGFKSYFVYDRERDLLVAIFSNNTSNDPLRIAMGLMMVLGYR